MVSKTNDVMQPEAIIVLGGAFSPVHQGHVNTLDAGARVAEERGFKVVAKYMAVSTAFYCQHKYGADLIPEEHRLAMCNLVSTPTDGVNPFDLSLAKKMNR